MTETPMDPTLAAHIAARNAAYLTANGPAGAAYLEDVLANRAARYAAHVARMTIGADFAAWSLAMAAKYGRFVKSHHYVADWITALLILRYGEEPNAYDADEVVDALATGRTPACSTDPNYRGWPLAFTDEDSRRAAQLLTGEKWPARVFALLGNPVAVEG